MLCKGSSCDQSVDRLLSLKRGSAHERSTSGMILSRRLLFSDATGGGTKLTALMFVSAQN